jgi:hypothetical protein
LSPAHATVVAKPQNVDVLVNMWRTRLPRHLRNVQKWQEFPFVPLFEHWDLCLSWASNDVQQKPRSQLDKDRDLKYNLGHRVLAQS